MRQTMICLPGLGGHPSVFSGYADLLPEYDLRFAELVDRQKALREVRALISEEDGPVVLFCHCYSAQMGIQLAMEMPDKISEMIFLEPFFVEFQPWLRRLLPLNRLLLRISRAFGRMGLGRKKFAHEPDYAALAKYPIYMQPVFDMLWQDTTHYLDKCLDILSYKLPARVEAAITMLFSPQGFSRDPRIKERLKNIFPQARIVEMQSGTHNVITMAGALVAAAVREEMQAAKPT